MADLLCLRQGEESPRVYQADYQFTVTIHWMAGGADRSLGFFSGHEAMDLVNNLSNPMNPYSATDSRPLKDQFEAAMWDRDGYRIIMVEGEQ